MITVSTSITTFYKTKEITDWLVDLHFYQSLLSSTTNLSREE